MNPSLVSPTSPSILIWIVELHLPHLMHLMSSTLARLSRTTWMINTAKSDWGLKLFAVSTQIKYLYLPSNHKGTDFTISEGIKEFCLLLEEKEASKLIEESGQCTYINGAVWRLGVENLAYLTAWQILIRVAIITVVFLLFSFKCNKAGLCCYDLHQYITYERSSFCWKRACKAAKIGRYIPFRSHFHQMQTAFLTINLPEPEVTTSVTEGFFHLTQPAAFCLLGATGGGSLREPRRTASHWFLGCNPTH